LDEIKLKHMQGDDDAHRLATALSDRAFRFGDKTIKPIWTVGQTGRVTASKPAVQNTKGKHTARVAGLRSGLESGDCLVHVDIKSAEPSLIKHLLNIPSERDLYAEYIAATGCERDDAKQAVNTLAYCRNAMRCFAHWPIAAQDQLRDYVEKLDVYKAGLWTECQKTRSVTTLTGRPIKAREGERLHPGRIMNWRIQGTVADVVNAACLSLLPSASVIIPVHDAIYAILPSGKTELVAMAITGRAGEKGLPLKVTTDVYKSG